MFTDQINTIISNGVENIGRKDIIQKGVSRVRWSWDDDEGQPHTNKFNNVLNFTESLVNILRAILFSGSTKYYEGT